MVINVTNPSSNQPPTAVATANTASGNAPLAVQFTGSNSSDPEGAIADYLWTFGDGDSANIADPTHSFIIAGNFTTTLVVTGSQGLRDTTSVVVNCLCFKLTNNTCQ